MNMRMFVGVMLGVAMLGCSEPNTVPSVAQQSLGQLPCSLDAECPESELCMQGLCTANPCANGACENSGCSDRYDCEAGRVCDNGVCIEPPDACTSSADCPVGTICDAFSGLCEVCCNVCRCDNAIE